MSDATRPFSETVHKPLEDRDAAHCNVLPPGSLDVRHRDERLPVGVCLLIWLSISGLFWTLAVLAVRWILF